MLDYQPFQPSTSPCGVAEKNHYSLDNLLLSSSTTVQGVFTNSVICIPKLLEFAMRTHIKTENG